jgi:O-acetyl-ADP-ribose deacetylase (regulator of RNase III)
MGGGIDAVLKKIFPGIEKKVQACIKEKKLAVSSFGEIYLPVGNCIIVETKDKRCPYLASCPTMFLPQNIEGTNNVSDAFYGLLSKIGDTDMVCAVCGMGTGVGGLDGTECANQIKNAYERYYKLKLDD